MLTEVTNKTELETGTSKLSTDIIDLKSITDSISSTLNSIESYEDINISGPASTLSSNLEAISTDLEISSQNISNYVNNLLLIDKEEPQYETEVPAPQIDDITLPDLSGSTTGSSTSEFTTSVTDSFTSPSSTSGTSEPVQVSTLTNSDTVNYSNTSAVSTTTPVSAVSNTVQESTPAQNTSSTPAPEPVTSTPAQNTGDGSVDISKYNNLPERGFNVTTGNATYNLSASDYDLLCAIVAAESDKTFDDALAVATTILNRCEAPNWVASFGTNPISQATAPNQFVVYQHGSYAAYTNGNAPDTVKQAVSDALKGVRNHNYLSFRSNGSTGYSSNQITSTGNRYK